MAYGVIYCITCKLNGKQYVGQTKRTIKKRFKEHAKAKSHLGYAIRKYKRKNFTIEVIEKCETKAQLNEREMFWIVKLNCKHPNGYNLTDGGEGFSGLEHTPEHNAKIAAALTGKQKSPEHCAKLAVAKTLTAKRAYSPYSNLVAILARRGVSYTELAKALEMTQEAMSYKMCGKHNFSYAQMEVTKNFLGVDMTLEELFSRADGVIPNFEPKAHVYPVLATELHKRKITHKQLGEALGLDRSSVGLKMRGRGEFSEEQKAAVRDFLGIDTPLEELFKRRD